MLVEGYLQTPPVMPADEALRLREGIRRLAEADLPPVFILMYEEAQALLARASRVLEPVLGPQPQLLAANSWAFHVMPGDAALTRWSAFAPHRDWLGGDPGVLQRELPVALSIWIPIVDVTTLDSCMYIGPAHRDPDYYASDYRKQWDRIRLQDIRALPAEAGSVLAWTSHLIHWGSGSSPLARAARISINCDLQRYDAVRLTDAIDPEAAIPFDHRVDRVMATIARLAPTVAAEQPKKSQLCNSLSVITHRIRSSGSSGYSWTHKRSRKCRCLSRHAAG